VTKDILSMPKSTPLRLFGLPMLRAIREDPLGLAERLHAEQGDMAWLRILSTRICYVFNPETVRQVLVEHQQDFAKEERILRIFQTVHGKNVISTEGELWERQRQILSPAFAPKRMQAYVELMASAADQGVRLELPGSTGDSAVVDVDRLITRITMDVILRALFSYEGSRAQSDDVGRAMRRLTRQTMRELFWPLVPPGWAPYPGRSAKRKSLAVIHHLIDSQIALRRRRSNSGERTHPDILDLLLKTDDDHEVSSDAALTDQEVRDNCIGLFGAGHDTSASALTWWLGLMASYPQMAQQVREELKGLPEGSMSTAKGLAEAQLLNATIKEAMRLYPPSTATFSRRALRDVRLGDHVIVKQSLMVIPIWSLHRDSRWFPDPEVFRPERFMPGAPAIPRSAFMPFGVGPHFCLGQQFAMVEMALIAARLIRCHDVSFEQGASLPVAEVDLVLKPKQPLRLRFTRVA
jgi:cytochrome P450